MKIDTMSFINYSLNICRYNFPFAQPSLIIICMPITINTNYKYNIFKLYPALIYITHKYKVDIWLLLLKVYFCKL